MHERAGAVGVYGAEPRYCVLGDLICGAVPVGTMEGPTPYRSGMSGTVGGTTAVPDRLGRVKGGVAVS